MAEYYYSDGNQKYGPYTVAEMLAKKLEPETLVWHDRLSDWMRAGDLPELFPSVASHEIKVPPPIPPGGIPKRSAARTEQKREPQTFKDIIARYRWVIAWCVFHILAFFLAGYEVKYFNTAGI
ncbi:MAG: DUF4339 domain-containing protein, partial [Gemmatimonadaceae bacterium]|nr:DUF4339 domain-containing protein [Chitinophagaceae bacterium]